MEQLKIDGIKVLVAYDSPSLEPERVGEVSHRGVSGSLLRTERANKDSWSLRTLPLTKAEFEVLYPVLEETPPFVTAEGEIIGGSKKCDVVGVRVDDHLHLRRIINFTLEEVQQDEN